MPFFFELSIKENPKEVIFEVYKVLAEAEIHVEKNGYNYVEISRRFCKIRWSEGETAFREGILAKQRTQCIIDCTFKAQI